jgi:hypothetical protein
MIFNNIHIVFECLSFVIASLSYSRLKKSFMVYFIPFLGFLLLSETLAMSSTNTVLLYSIVNPVTHCFYVFIFCSFLLDQRRKIQFVSILASYCVACFIGYFADNSEHILFYYLVAFGGLMEVYFSCTVFYRFISSDDITPARNWNSGLWIASGVLIFYSAVSLCFSLHGYIVQNELKLFGLYLFHIIPRILSPILYACLSMSFVLWKKSNVTLS